MKKILITTLVVIFALNNSYSQIIDELNFQHELFDLNANPRSQLSPMSIKLFDDYLTYRPTPATAPGNNSYGSLLAMYGRNNHWEHNLYFGADKKIYYRMSVYPSWTAENGTLGGYNDWRTILDSKSDIESNGVLRLTGSGDHYLSQGKLGIGTTTPGSHYAASNTLKLEVNGDMAVNVGYLISVDHRWHSHGFLQYDGAISGARFKHYGYYGHRFDDNGGTRMVILQGGKVGIGTTSPNQMLSVNGTINAEEIILEDVNGADFVFEEDYDLRSLEETEEFIKTNKHLPEIPSAEEMAEEGIELKVMNVLLLQKIEELTLHLIELKKENKRQNEEIEKLKAGQ